MAGKFFRIQDGLSQSAREFKELAPGFYSIDSVPQEAGCCYLCRLCKAYGSRAGGA